MCHFESKVYFLPMKSLFFESKLHLHTFSFSYKHPSSMNKSQDVYYWYDWPLHLRSKAVISLLSYEGIQKEPNFSLFQACYDNKQEAICKE